MGGTAHIRTFRGIPPVPDILSKGVARVLHIRQQVLLKPTALQQPGCYTMVPTSMFTCQDGDDHDLGDGQRHAGGVDGDARAEQHKR